MTFYRRLLALLMLLPSAALAQTPPSRVVGYKDFSAQAKLDADFIAVPSPEAAELDLQALTAAPHVAGSKEDKATAEYVAAKFRAAGLQTSIVPYVGWMNLPQKIEVKAFSAGGRVLMSGPTREDVTGDRYENDPRIVTPFSSGSPSADVTAGVVYANYGRREDFAKLDRLGVSVKDKIVLVRYGASYRGSKVLLAQQRGAAGVILYSDPQDDGYYRGDAYPDGPYRPETGVQRGSVEFTFMYPGDVTSPGIASTPDLPAQERIAPDKADVLPKIPATPLSWHDAAPILRSIGGRVVPRDWQGALPFTYHVGGAGKVKVHMLLEQSYAFRPLWVVIGEIPGTEYPNEWVIAGNHRDAWTFGAADPGSGTVAMLEAVRGIGTLLKQGWKPKRTVIFANWDGEEEGLIGSTEWAEGHAGELAHAVAYFNMDIGVSGPSFVAEADPSLNQFLRDVTMQVPSPNAGSVYEQWKTEQAVDREARSRDREDDSRWGETDRDEVRIGKLGSGSDFTAFYERFGVPSTNISSIGPYGAYHSAFDDFQWFAENADPSFVFEQQQARVFGLEVLNMADADVLPYDYVTYARDIAEYLVDAETKARGEKLDLNFDAALAGAHRFLAAAETVRRLQADPEGNEGALNAALREAEEDLLAPQGLPNRSWYKHTIYAPGEYTGYAAQVIPGVNEAIEAHDETTAQQQLDVLAKAVTRAAMTLEGVGK